MINGLMTGIRGLGFGTSTVNFGVALYTQNDLEQVLHFWISSCLSVGGFHKE